MTKSNRRIKRLREERAARAMAKAVERLNGNDPSEGQYCLLDLDTGERIKGLNHQQATALWERRSRAVILHDEYVR